MPHAITCPQCHAGLRSARPVPENKLVRCPQCGSQFATRSTKVIPAPNGAAATLPMAIEDPSTLPMAIEVPPPPPEPTVRPLDPVQPARRSAAVSWPILAGSAVLLGTLSAALGYSLRARVPQEASVAAPKQDEEALRRLQEENKKLKSQLDEQRGEIQKQLRQVQFDQRMAQGDAALSAKKYPEAIQAYRKALELLPDDPKAKAALTDAKTSREAAEAVAARDKDEREKRTGEVQRLMKEGREAVGKKEYAAAVRAFEGARLLAPADTEISKALSEAQTALDADTAEKKKLDEYRKHMAAGKAALDAQQFADAVREYAAAQELFPGDPDSAQGQKSAENSMAAIKDLEKRKSAYRDLLDRGNAALKDRKYDEAVASLAAAQKIFPDDKATDKALKAARAARNEARQQYTGLVEQADAALQLRRFEEAHRLYSQAIEVLPGGTAAQRGMEVAANALNDLRAGRAGYARFITQAGEAMRLRQFAEAARLYREALRIAPGDPIALQGLRAAQAELGGPLNAAVNADAALQAGTQALKMRQYGDAIKAFEDALKLAPGNPDAVAGLRKARCGKAKADGQKALIAGRIQDAIDAFQAALKEVPDDPAATAGLNQARALKR
jgi:tetratricopeptide (TPR) repeat protein